MIYYLKLYFSRSLDEVTSLIDDEIFHGSLEKIIEVTYSYKDIWEWNLYNETLFEDYLKVPYSKNMNLSVLWKKYSHKIYKQIWTIDDSIKKLEHLNVLSRVESLRRSILIDALLYVRNILELSSKAVVFEIEKAWDTIWIIDSQRNRLLHTIESLEKKAFWPLVMENSGEFSRCYNFIERNHNLQKSKLSRSDVIKMNKFLKIIKNSRKCDFTEIHEVPSPELEEPLFNIDIQRKDYRKIFDSVCEIYNLPQRTVLSNAGSIYDWDESLEIPRNENFSCLPLDRVLKLLTHEIESHYINQYNWKKILWNFRWAKNLPKEEWLAMFMERIYLGYTYDTIDTIVEYFFTILAWEILSWEDFQEFMRIMVTEYKCMRSYDVAVLRAKRNYSFHAPWVQHKDVVYFRGLTEVIDYLKTWWEFKKLFLWKVWFLDLDNMYDLYQRYEKKEEIVFPLFISDLISYYFKNLEKNNQYEFNIQEYNLFLKKKYWFLDLDSFKIIQRLTEDWNRIDKLLQFLKKILIK